MPRFKDQAVCIRHLDWSETSQVVALFTREHGVLRGLAKGSKRNSPSHMQRYSGGIEMLTLGRAVGIVREQNSLATLTEWDLQNPFAHLRQNLATLNLGLYAADLTGAMLAEHDAHPAVFDALTELLAGLAKPGDRQAALLVFQWRLLVDSGYRPHIYDDARSGEPLKTQASYAFDPLAGGLTGEALTQRHTRGAGPWGVRAATVRMLRQLDRGETIEDAAVALRANQLLCVYVRSILDRTLPTMRLILDGEG